MRVAVALIVCLASASCTANLMTGGEAIELLAPVDSETLSGTVSVIIRIAEPQNAGRIEVTLGDTTVATWSQPRSRLEAELDTRAFEDGIHQLAISDTSTTPSRELLRRGVLLDNHGPEVEIVEPGESVFFDDGPFVFSVQATDVSSISRIRMRAGSTVVSDTTGAGSDSWVVEVDPATILGMDMEGAIPLAVEAIDETGARTEVTQTVTVRRRELWYATEDPTSVAPVSSGDSLAVVTDDGLAVYTEAGMVRCRIAGVGASTSPIALPGEDAVLWSTIERMRIVSLSDCAIRWEQATPASDFVSAAAAHDGRVYVATFAGSLTSFAYDGTDLETIALGDALPTPPSSLEIGRGLAIAPNGTAWVGGALGAGRGVVFQVSTTGTVRALELPAPIDAGIAATNEGAFVGGVDGTFYKVGTDMMRAWREEPQLSEGHPIECTPVVLEDGNVVTCDGAGRVLAIAASDGRIVWEYDASVGRVPFRLLGTGGMSRGGAGNGLLAVGDRLGMLHVIDLSGNLRWRIQLTEMPAAIVDRPAMDASHLYAVTEHGLIAALAL